MGTHVITSSIDDIKSNYKQVFDQCSAVVSIDWLRHCDHAQSVVDTAKYNLLLTNVDKKRVINHSRNNGHNRRRNDNYNQNHNRSSNNNQNHHRNDNDLMNMSQTSITTTVTHYNPNPHRNNNRTNYVQNSKPRNNTMCMDQDEKEQYDQFIANCLNMNKVTVRNKNLFKDLTFNINKLSLNEQRKIEKLIRAANGIICKGGQAPNYLICQNISTAEFENYELEDIQCVSIIYIHQCLEYGEILDVHDCVSFFPELLCSQQTNCLFEDLTICITQFNNDNFERYRIRSLLAETNCTYQGSFHPARCDILICNKCQGKKYEVAAQNDVIIVNFMWLIDSIKNGKQMDHNQYKSIPKPTPQPSPIPPQQTKQNKKANRKRSSILGDVLNENLQNALTNFRLDDDNDFAMHGDNQSKMEQQKHEPGQNNERAMDLDTIDVVDDLLMDNDDTTKDLCSPALASTIPPNTNNNGNKNGNTKSQPIDIGDDTTIDDGFDLIEVDNNDPLDDLTNFSTQQLREKYEKQAQQREEHRKQRQQQQKRTPKVEGIEDVSPIKMTRNFVNDYNKNNDNKNTNNRASTQRRNEGEIMIFCHHLVEKNKQSLINDLVNKYGLQKAKSLNRNVTHYVIDIALTDKTKQMRDAKEKQQRGLLQIVNSKWLLQKLREFRDKERKNNNNKNGHKYEENSITRARKRKYKDCEFDEYEYDGESSVSDEIDGFDDDDDIIGIVGAKCKQKMHHKKKRRKKNHGSDIRKHITMKNKIGVLLTGVGGKIKTKYEQIIRDLNGVVLTEENYHTVDDNDDGEINFKYIVAAKLVRSEKIIIGIIQKKVIVKTSYLDACKKASKWLPSEPHCWMNDEALIKHIPADGTEMRANNNNQTLKGKVDLVQAIRIWQQKDVKKSCFYNKNIFIWLPSNKNKTFYKILRSNGANVYSIDYQNIDESIENSIIQCQNIEANIAEVYLANEDEIKIAAKAYCKSKGKQNDKVLIENTRKQLMKKLRYIAEYWTTKKKLLCYDSDYVLDWVLEIAVFKNSDATMDEYKFSLE